MSVSLDIEGNLVYDTWYNSGGMVSTRRDSLHHTDPNNLYNYVSSAGFTPEEYGIMHPLTGRYKSHTREQLLQEITELQQALDNWHQYGGG